MFREQRATSSLRRARALALAAAAVAAVLAGDATAREAHDLPASAAADPEAPHDLLQPLRDAARPDRGPTLEGKPRGDRGRDRGERPDGAPADAAPDTPPPRDPDPVPASVSPPPPSRPPPPPRDVVRLEVMDTQGPPALSCTEALAALPDELAPSRRQRAATTATAAESEVRLRRGAVTVDVSTLEAMTPEKLPEARLEGPPEARERIAALWARAQAGEPVRLSFFGASHTGGDWWTGELRRTLQDRWGDRGHGFVMPAPLYAGYRGQDVNLCSSQGWTSGYVGKSSQPDDLLGFMGANVRASHEAAFAWVETTHSNPHGRRFDTARVFALGGPGAGTLALIVDNAPRKLVSLARPNPILVEIEVRVADGPHRLTLQPAGDGEVRLFGVSLERAAPGVLIDAMGIRGRTARTWLRWDERLLAAGLHALAPDLVVLAYGTNEANDEDYDMEAYRADLHAVLDRLRATVPEDVPCVLVGPSDRVVKGPDRVYEPWPRTAPVAVVQREVAAARGCLFWDWQRATGGEGSMLAFREHDAALAAGDLIHFTRAGYIWSAERFLAALDDAAREGAERSAARGGADGDPGPARASAPAPAPPP